MNFIIKSSYTAISNGVSKSSKKLSENLNDGDIVLDYGCGKLRNTIYLKNKNENVFIDVVDLKEQIDKLDKDKIDKYVRNIYEIPLKCENDTYNKVLCSFVINVIEDEEERINIIKNIYNCLKKDGFLYLEVRTFNFLMNLKNYEKYKDGYLIGKNKIRTFQKPFGTAELYDIILKSKTDFILIDTIVSKDSIIIILQK